MHVDPRMNRPPATQNAKPLKQDCARHPFSVSAKGGYSREYESDHCNKEPCLGFGVGFEVLGFLV